MSLWLERLSREFSEAESSQIQAEIFNLKGLQVELESLSTERLQEGLIRMAPYRLKYSGNLRHGRVETWQQANSYIAEKIQTNQAPTWQDILNLNALLTNQVKSEIRTKPVYLGPFEACPPEELTSSLQYFENHILQNKDQLHPLIATALCQYWLVSLHPFEDGNGRTSVVLSDWLLGLHGYLPMSFDTKIDGLIATLSNDRVSATPGNAVIKLITNVQRSYRLVLNDA
ncbi:hypothetical protein AZI85_08675 [Bdellovibrio bacteriovorus]|uniref:Fido domain-containing protein n=1 Tax=Bdellovibrio bacteriovorus TaxID=959 RepID=A0A150WD84_BDEBC|nr:Fic family protein [Bdellovibrio bacteriovorus]KYG61025.1 hypothetical protein AZI85_08675 [Bdellovibrio bacteriovorus]